MMVYIYKKDICRDIVGDGRGSKAKYSEVIQERLQQQAWEMIYAWGFNGDVNTKGCTQQ